MHPAAARSTAAIWDELLSLQAELFIPSELAFFLEAPELRNARSILDVGCGNGDYVANLCGYLPGTRFTGIDVSAELVAAAARRHDEPQLAFAHRDFFDYVPAGAPHDAILFRFVVQHLRDFGAVLRHAASCLAPGGSVVVIEVDRDASLAQPAMPRFDAMIDAYVGEAARRGRMRAQLDRMAAIATGLPGWTVVREAPIRVPFLGPFEGTKVARLYQSWIDICERTGGFEHPFDDVRSEVSSWARESSAFSRLAGRALQIRRDPN
ncbi:MAG: methyltransferase domain-containing protein [Bauldia sp.]|nr:methyltransferase domain-containing protein [Bauldia sp.]